MNSITPIFPCTSLDELLQFYQTLGFDVTYHQKSPSPYAVVEKGWIKLDFYGNKHHDPQKCYHTCYILTQEADELYQTFTDALRSKYGKLPTRGLPRISEIRDKTSGVREFMFSDVAGNCIRIGKKINKQDDEAYTEEIKAANKRLSLALDFAYKSEDEPNEYEIVSKIYDKAIERDKDKPCINLFKVMIHRADIAIGQGERQLAKELLEKVKTNHFFQKNIVNFKVELDRIHDIEMKL